MSAMSDKTSGPTVVFVPGLLSDAVVWQPAADRIAATHGLAIADVSQGTSITGMAQDVLVENPGDIIVAGHSMGARVALEMARIAPDRVNGLVLADTGIHPKREGEEAKRQAMLDLAHEKGMAALAKRWLPPMVHEARHSDRELMDALTAMVLRADAAQHDRQIGALIGRPDASAYLDTITCPVLLIVGRQDAWSPIAQHETMLEKLPHAGLVVIEEAGHFAPIEQPRTVGEAIAAWLGELTAAEDTAAEDTAKETLS